MADVLVDANSALTTGSIGIFEIDELEQVEGPRWGVQIYTAGQTHVLSAIAVKVRRTNYCYDATARVEIFAVADDKPTGAALDSAEMLAQSISTGGGWYTFTFTGGVTLNVSTQYAIVVSCPGSHIPTTGYIDWLYSNENEPGGLLWTDDGGDTWEESYFNTLDYNFRTYKPQSLSKPTTPTPADGSGPGVDFSTFTFSWVNGGGATTYRVYIGDSPFNLNWYEQTSATSYTPADESAAKSLILATQGTIYWRVDAGDSTNWVTGDVWNFDPKPAKVALVAPADAATGQRLHIAADWNAAAAAESYTFRIIAENGLLPTVIEGLTETDLADIDAYLHLQHDTKYYWRVDTVNQFGATEGDTWWFRTDKFHTILPPWELIPGHTQGPEDDPPGVPGVDFRWLGTNSMITTKRLVAVAMNRFWYEDV